MLSLLKSKSHDKLCIQVRKDLKEKAEKLGIDIGKFLESLINALLLRKAMYDLTKIIKESEIYFTAEERKYIAEEVERILKEAAESAEAKLRKLSQAGSVDTLPPEN